MEDFRETPCNYPSELLVALRISYCCSIYANMQYIHIYPLLVPSAFAGTYIQSLCRHPRNKRDTPQLKDVQRYYFLMIVQRQPS